MCLVMIKNVLKDSVIYTVPSLLTRGTAFLLLPLYTSIMTPSEYGLLDLVFVFAAIVQLTLTLEISQGLSRFFTSEPDRGEQVRYSASSLWFTISAYSVFCTLLLMFYGTIANLITSDDAPQNGSDLFFILAIFYVWSSGVYLTLQNQFRWEFKALPYALTSIFSTIISVSSVIILAYFLNKGLNGILLGLIIGQVIGGCINFVVLRQSFPFIIDVNALKKMLGYSFPLVFAAIAVWLNTYIDRVMIASLLSLNELGVYAAGIRLASIVSLAFIGLQGALSPYIFANYKKAQTKQEIATLSRYFVVFATAILVLLGISSQFLVSVILGADFAGANAVILILATSFILAQSYIFAPGIFIAGKTHFVVFINVAGGVVNFGLNLLLIPLFGMIGAALATLLGALLVFVIYMWLGQKDYAISYEWKSIGITILLAILAVLSASYSATLWVSLPVGIILFCGGIYLFSIIRVSEIEALISMVRKPK